MLDYGNEIDMDQSDTPNKPTVISVDHVSMVFNMASEQLNNLKEYAIALARRELRFKEFRALNDISLEIKKGDVFGILGTNGSGKSTLMKIIAGVLTPTEGTVSVEGRIAPLIELGAGFDMDLTARENIYLNGALLGYSKKLIEEHFDDIVSFAEIEEFLDIPVKNYSSGMIARIAFSIATVIVPEILLVDEVLSVGDFMFRKKCENRIRQLIDEYGVTVLIVSHSNDQIERLCNKAIWIEKGNEKVRGSAKDVAQVYACLGGRKESPRSEDIIFRSLRSSAKEDDLIPLRHCFEGNPFEVSLAMTSQCDQILGAPQNVILASCASHVNILYANALAPALNARILPLPLSDTPINVIQYLLETQPEHLMYIDCGHGGREEFEKLAKLPFSSEAIDISGPGNLIEYSQMMLEYGIEEGCWEGSEVTLFEADDLMLSLDLVPYLFARSSPVIIKSSSHEDDIQPLISLAKDNGFKAINVFGSACQSETMLARCEGLEVELFPQTIPSEADAFPVSCSLYNDMIDQHHPEAFCLASLEPSQWMNYMSLGPYLNITKTLYHSVDLTNLDSIAECMTSIAAAPYGITEMDIIQGKDAFSPMEQKMFRGKVDPEEPSAIADRR